MKNQHTPGPWRTHGTYGLKIVAGSRGTHIAEAASVGLPNCEANARLLAAAPELLALVEKFDVIMRGMGPLYASGPVATEVAALVARVKGE